LLVGEDHTYDVCRRGFLRLLEQVREAHQGPLAIACEALSVDVQSEIEASLDGGNDAVLLALLQRSWPWPVREYVNLLRRARELDVDILAVGSQRVGAPGANQLDDLDEARRPTPTTGCWQDLPKENRVATGVVAKWLKAHTLRRHSPPRVLVLFGMGHLAGTDNLDAMLATRGYSTSLVAIADPSLEFALRTRWRDLRWTEWVRIGPSAYRAGVLPEFEWLRWAEFRHREFDRLVARIPKAPSSHEEVSYALNRLIHLIKSHPRRAAPVVRRYLLQPRIRYWEKELLREMEPNGT
jgi:hypothetical protein